MARHVCSCVDLPTYRRTLEETGIFSPDTSDDLAAGLLAQVCRRRGFPCREAMGELAGGSGGRQEDSGKGQRRPSFMKRFLQRRRKNNLVAGSTAEGGEASPSAACHP
jgi:hypothetical protein